MLKQVPTAEVGLSGWSLADFHVTRACEIGIINKHGDLGDFINKIGSLLNKNTD